MCLAIPGKIIKISTDTLSKVDEAEAARTYQALERMEQLTELDIPDVADDGTEVVPILMANGQHSPAVTDNPGEQPAARVA
ncbi:MAG: hypothetical protein M3Q46_09850 [Verrucomicrobiota bacterium]|nr:hypothetical protein [Verrucomicrobiota bacterium]